MRLQISAPAKINLYLDITGQRGDGYHLINTVMQAISLYDEVTVSIDKNGSGITLSCTDSNIPCDNKNTAYIAAEKFFDYNGLAMPGVNIRIRKRIPYGAGMAGGSTDAAAVIIALDELLNTRLERDELSEIAEQVGADVPFCLFGGTAAASGIGTILSPLPDMPQCGLVIIKPDFSISTGEAYKLCDKAGYEDIRSMEHITEAICSGSIVQTAKELYNRFEVVTGNEKIDEIKDRLLQCGALGAVMTGSGSAVYGIFETASAADDCRAELRDEYENIFTAHPIAAGQQITGNGGFLDAIFGDDPA